jgi:death-on-curing protein
VIEYLNLEDVLRLHGEAIRKHGGSSGVRDLGLIDSAASQPQATFAGHELYPSLPEKAAALGFSLIANHGFIDGNKRVGLAAMDVFLRMNGQKIVASADDLERAILDVASGRSTREQLAAWIEANSVAL